MDGPTVVSVVVTAASAIALFSSVRTRVEKLERFQDIAGPKLDRVQESLNRIEGRFIEADRHTAAHGD